MKEFWKDTDVCVEKELILPVAVKASQGIDRVEGQVPIPGAMLQVKVENGTVYCQEQ